MQKRFLDIVSFAKCVIEAEKQIDDKKFIEAVKIAFKKNNLLENSGLPIHNKRLSFNKVKVEYLKLIQSDILKEDILDDFYINMDAFNTIVQKHLVKY